MNKTTFHISKMDCGAEEQLVRMQLEGEATIRKLIFDLPGRKLEVYHEQGSERIEQKIQELNLGSKLVNTINVPFLEEEMFIEGHKAERKLLWIVFSINFGFFVVEIITGVLARSMG